MSPNENQYVPGNNVVHGVVATGGRNANHDKGASGNFRFDDSMKQMKHKSQQQYEQSHQHSKARNGYHRGQGNFDENQHYEISARHSEQESTSSMRVKLADRSPQEEGEDIVDEDEEKRQLQQQYQQDYSYGEEDEDCIEIDEQTVEAIIKVQALIRGFLTRKMIFEHLQRMVQQN